jgi:ribosomal protein L28
MTESNVFVCDSCGETAVDGVRFDGYILNAKTERAWRFNVQETTTTYEGIQPVDVWVCSNCSRSAFAKSKMKNKALFAVSGVVFFVLGLVLSGLMFVAAAPSNAHLFIWLFVAVIEAVLVWAYLAGKNRVDPPLAWVTLAMGTLLAMRRGGNKFWSKAIYAQFAARKGPFANVR